MRTDLIWHEVEQGGQAWFDLRAGKITGTSAKELLVKGRGEDGIGAGLWTLIYKLAGEIVTGETDQPFDNYATMRGKSLEDLAVKEYEDTTFLSTNKVGFIQWGDYCGVSPDFMVDGDRGGEVKCLLHTNHLRYAHTKDIDAAHMAQIQWALFVTGFKYWDMVHYHPKAGRQKLIIDTVVPDAKYSDRFEEMLPKVEERIAEVVSLCKE